MAIINKSLIGHPMNWLILFLMSILIMFAGQLILRQLGIAHPMSASAPSSSANAGT